MIDFYGAYGNALAQRRAEATDNNAFNERMLDRRIAQNEAQRARDQQFALQDNELYGRRQLANDQYGYNAALSDQEFGQRNYLTGQGYVHDNELFERRAAADFSRQQLDRIQAERMAAMQRDATRERDYLLQDFHQQDVSQQQDFTVSQGDTAYERSKELGAINHQYGLETQDVSHQYGMDLQGQQQDYNLKHDQQLARQHLLEEKFHNEEAAKLKEVEAKITDKYRRQEFDEVNQQRAKEIVAANKVKTIEENREGIANRTHKYLSDDDRNDAEFRLPNVISQIEKSPNATREEKDAALAPVYRDLNEIYYRAKRIDEKSQLQSYADEHGIQQEDYRYITPGKFGPTFDTNRKKMELQFRPIMPEERMQFFQNIGVDPRQYPGAILTRSENGQLTFDDNWVKLQQFKEKQSAANKAKPFAEEAAIGKEIDRQLHDEMVKWDAAEAAENRVPDTKDAAKTAAYNMRKAQTEQSFRTTIERIVREQFANSQQHQGGNDADQGWQPPQGTMQPQPSQPHSSPSSASGMFEESRRMETTRLSPKQAELIQRAIIAAKQGNKAAQQNLQRQGIKW